MYLKYDYCDHVSFLQLFAKKMSVPIVNDSVALPAYIGSGYVKAKKLCDGFQILITNCDIFEKIVIGRSSSTGNQFTLRFDDIRSINKKLHETESLDSYKTSSNYSGIMFTNAINPVEYSNDANVKHKSISIYFTKEWFQRHLNIAADDKIWNDILCVDKAVSYFEVLSIEYRELMDDILSLDNEYPFYLAALQNRAMLLLEFFLRRVYEKYTSTYFQTMIPNEDIGKIIAIENILVEDAFNSPPSIAELGKIAMMSETKLKTLFKRIYGYNIYEYYQRNRMLKAKQLITSNKYSIKEVGIQLGFKNLSNFAVAYRKVFKTLPSQTQINQ